MATITQIMSLFFNWMQ